LGNNLASVICQGLGQVIRDPGFVKCLRVPEVAHVADFKLSRMDAFHPTGRCWLTGIASDMAIFFEHVVDLVHLRFIETDAKHPNQLFVQVVILLPLGGQRKNLEEHLQLPRLLPVLAQLAFFVIVHSGLE